MSKCSTTYDYLSPQLEDYLIWLIGENAISYLFRIAAGLESLVLGEDQISQYNLQIKMQRDRKKLLHMPM